MVVMIGHVGGAAAPHGGRRRWRFRLGRGRRFGRRCPATPRGSRRRRLRLFLAHPLFALPPSANT